MESAILSTWWTTKIFLEILCKCPFLSNNHRHHQPIFFRYQHKALSHPNISVDIMKPVAAGSKPGLSVTLRTYQQDLDWICKGPINGFRLTLHPPHELPSTSTQYILVPNNKEVVVAIKPDMTTTSRRLQNYESKKRLCYFSHEKRLMFFRKYSQQNCQVECLTNHTLIRCGCVAYHMPREYSWVLSLAVRIKVQFFRLSLNANLRIRESLVFNQCFK